MPNAIPAWPAETSDALLVVAIMLPVIGILPSLMLGGRHAERIATFVLPALLGVAAVIFAEVWQAGHALTYVVGNWNPPLGITLRADGLSAAMMIMSAGVMCGIAIFARFDFRTPADSVETRAPFAFWILILGISGAMNVVCLAGDLFTLYVALELLTFAAVPLVSLDGRAETLQAALRYLLFAVFGSVIYLLGAALLYGIYGTLDTLMLSRAVRADFVTILAAALMTTGLLAKTALFPLHLWLPPAHAGAPSAASAVLSALVVKGSFFVVVRLWFDVMPALPGLYGSQMLGSLGAAAVIFGGIMALRQQRLKLLVAYSTVAQIGYLFLMFPLALSAAEQLESGTALAGGMLQTMSHATAKAGMFLAAGMIYAALGHDRVAGLAGAGRALPIPILAFACAGFSLIGLPPGGGFLAKSLLLASPVATAQWWWDWIMSIGSVLTSTYLFVVLLRALTPALTPLKLRVNVPRYQQAAALALALTSLLLGMAAFPALDVLQVGRPELPAGYPAIPFVNLTDVFEPSAIAKAFWPAILGGTLAIGILYLQRAEPGSSTQRAHIDGRLFDQLDGVLRQWPVGTVSMLVLTLALGVAMIAAR
jgi:formate hydrogenlyase subunit 3/multisubunit Na+/H+ antiporter MnhD subunit